MVQGWRYRGVSLLGTVALTVLAVAVSSHPLVLEVVSVLPLLGRLPTDSPAGEEFLFEAMATTAVVVAALVPLFKPQPQRILDVAETAGKRVFLAIIALAAVGYFDYTYRLPRLTLIVAGSVLLVAIPLWFVAIRRRPTDGSERAVIIGDDTETMADILGAVDVPVLGYVSPPSAYFGEEVPEVAAPGYADGGVTESPLEALSCLGGLSRLDEVLVEYDVDTAFLAFARPDRAEFFGALDSCYEHGVTAKVHRDHADAVLTREFGAEQLVEIDLDPWDPQDYVIKRLFDLAFAATGLVALSPVILLIAVGIKLEDGGPILYRQERTAEFGDTFSVPKFRSMVPDAEDVEPVEDEENPYITRVGSVLRHTHLDEIPQLWSILRGEMSVVGPRAVWTEEETLLEENEDSWRKRWFVKPGLTGLAQVEDATSTDPEAKLRYDVEYIRRQSFWFDLKLVVRQLWIVGADAVSVALGESDDRADRRRG